MMLPLLITHIETEIRNLEEIVDSKLDLIDVSNARLLRGEINRKTYDRFERKTCAKLQAYQEQLEMKHEILHVLKFVNGGDTANSNPPSKRN